MRNTIPFYRSPQNPKFIGGLFLVIAFVILFAALHSCNPIKIAARKDVAAVDRVKGSRNLINQIAPIVNDLFPQPKDTLRIQGKPIIIKGKDSAYPVLIPFNIYTSKGKILDTLLRGVYIKIDTLGNIKIKLPSPDTSRIHDTIQLPADTRSKAIDGQTIANLNTLLSAANQSVIDSDKEAKDKGKWVWWFIGACVVAVASNGVWVYSKLKI